MISIPPQGKNWTQPNSGELAGSLFSTRNMDFDKKGYAKLARRSTALVYNVTNFGSVTSIQTLNGETYYCMTDGRIFSTDLKGSTTDLFNATGRLGSLKLDGVIWQGLWWISQSTSVTNYDGASWNVNLSGASLTASQYHPLCVHEGLNQLAVGDYDSSQAAACLVYLYSYTNVSTITKVKTISMPSSFEVRWIRYNNNYLYIGTRNIKNGEAFVFVSDGTSTISQYGIKVPNSSWAFSGTIYKGNLVIFTSKGQLLRLNGQGWEVLASLPVLSTPYTWWDGNNSFANGKMEARGMEAFGDRIYMNLDGRIDAPGNIQLPNQPSGLWIYDPDIGLYHKAGLSTPTGVLSTTTNVNTSTDVMTIATYTAPTGTKVLVYTTDATPLLAATFYYLIRVSSTTFKLATSYSNAIAGTQIDLTAGTNTGTVIAIHDDDSFGESIGTQYQPGALALIGEKQTSVSNYREYLSSRVLFGAAQVFPYIGSTGVYTLQTLTAGENRGSIITPKIPSAEIKDTWQKFITRFDRLFQGNDKIIVKYRTSEKEGYPLFVGSSSYSGVFTSPTTFTTTADLSTVSAGDEIEFCAGRGAGCCAHLTTAPTLSAGTYTVTLDEVIPNVSVNDTTYNFLFQNWTKLRTGADSSTLGNLLESVLDTSSSKWIQFKVEVRGVSEPYLELLQLISEANQKGV